MKKTPIPHRLVFARPSRSGGPDHRVSVNAVSLRPLSCTCPAGQRDIVCWAALEVARDECYAEAARRWQAAKGFLSREFAEAARVLGKAARRRRIAIAVLAAREQRRTQRAA